jgi:CubicO group peptidase (beta-lactamase class C family)
MKIRVLIFNLLIVFSLPAYSNNSADDNKQNDTITHNIDQIMAQWDKEESPGAAIGVVKDGKLVFAKGYGSANLEYNIPITPSSIFHMASVSKQFTAFSIVLLAQQGIYS